MNITYIIAMFLSAIISLILELSELKEMSTLDYMQITFWFLVIVLMVYNYYKLNKNKKILNK